MSDAIARLGPPASSHTLGGLMDGFTEHKWELPGGSAELIADDSGVIEGGSVVADGQLKVSLPGPSLLGELTPQGLVATRGDPPAFDARWLAGRTSVGYGYCEGPNAAYDVAFVIVVADGVLDLSDKSTAEIRELTVTLPFGGFNFSPGNIGGHCPL